MPAIDYNANLNSTLPARQPALASAAASPSASSSDDGDFSFHDLLEIVNPLQHIPIVSTIYRAITGDKISTGDKILGDTLYGGPEGFVASLADTVFQEATGKDFGDTVLAFLTGRGDSQTAVASAAPAEVTPAQATPISDISLPSVPDVSGLLNALQSRFVAPSAAAGAYSKTMGLFTPASVH